ncbi:hypothetical protein EDB89DRAFT_1150113 [Lactarius sanguifluus]|nr:hypothetical protein EDB89DRAFT_1150113 [Lactarius sanguifluus]
MSGLFPAPQRLLFGPYASILGVSVSCLRGAMRHFHSCRRLPDPRLAAFRLNFWASAAGLYVGLGAFTGYKLCSFQQQHSASGMYYPSPQAAHRQFVWAITASAASSRAYCQRSGLYLFSHGTSPNWVRSYT